ncbi:hypothetical protein DRJ16_06775 [Candidatus Woesearchaeota archaeon]|nr:MAG: hypothetical protein DRJ16_06775 [Candidatus Woesearchaeota archaeon]
MALIEIDRHILTEIKANIVKVNSLLAKIDKYKEEVYKLHAKNEALFGHLINAVKEYDTQIGTESPAVKDGDKI